MFYNIFHSMYQLKYNQEDVPPLVLKFNVTVYKASC